MRIIAGIARGRAIAAPGGLDTRPTQDYVRESLFNILQREVPDAHVLDLFAGSGALGLEALSRGAADAVFSDCSADALRCIHRNAETLGFENSAEILRGDWQATLQRLAREGRRFTLAFLDPPYKMTDTGAQCARMADLCLLEPGALVVIEHRKETPPDMDARFTLRSERCYGDTVIHFYNYGGGD